jgi:hypothetical protein
MDDTDSSRQQQREIERDPITTRIIKKVTIGIDGSTIVHGYAATTTTTTLFR